MSPETKRQRDNTMMAEEQSQEIWELIKRYKVAMLTTIDNGVLRARPMYRVQKSFHGTLWFFAAKSSAKIEELQQCEEVCLTYSDPDQGTFISLSGKAGFTNDKALIEKFWGSFARPWFKEGKNDPDVALIEINVSQAEIWDAETNTMKQLYEMARSSMARETPKLARHQRCNFQRH